jgi:hypothetical protein
LQSSSCKACPEGQTTSQLSSTFCSNCSTGKFLNVSCTNCSVGKFQDRAGKTSCQLCSPGMFEANPGSVECSACLQGRYTPYYGQSVCQDCPRYDSFVICPAGSNAIIVPSGLWTNGTIMGNCLPFEACPEGNFTIGNASSCADGYTSEFCSKCSTGFFRLNGLCKKCLPNIVTWIVAVLVFVLVVFLFHKFINSKVVVPLNVRVGLFWLQLLSMYPLLFSGWPPALMKFFTFFSLFNLEIGYLGLGCSITNPYFKIMFTKLSLPLVLWLCLMLAHYIARLRNKKSDFNRITSVCLYLINFFALQMFSSMFQIFNCSEQGGYFWITADPTELCYSNSWYSFIGVDAGFIAFYLFGVPLYVFLRYREAGFQTSEPYFRRTFGSLMFSYRSDCQGFEVVRLTFKLSFVLIRDAFNISRIAKTAFLGLILASINWIEANLRPYESEETNAVSQL